MLLKRKHHLNSNERTHYSQGNKYLRQNLNLVQWDSLVAHTVKNLPAMQEIWVQSLCWEATLEKLPWRREWQLTPIFLPGKFHGLRSLAGYSPWGLKESDMTERLTLSVGFPSIFFSLQHSAQLAN